jgi:hypothetical protein
VSGGFCASGVNVLAITQTPYSAVLFIPQCLRIGVNNHFYAPFIKRGCGVDKVVGQILVIDMNVSTHTHTKELETIV